VSQESAIERIHELHKPKQSYDKYDDMHFDICDYDKTQWPCKTRMILEEEGIAPASPAKPLDPLPWTWGRGYQSNTREVRQSQGPHHDGPQGGGTWSHFAPRVAFEQDIKKYPADVQPKPREDI
jgi:hypothetical protein